MLDKNLIKKRFLYIGSLLMLFIIVITISSLYIYFNNSKDVFEDDKIKCGAHCLFTFEKVAAWTERSGSSFLEYIYIYDISKNKKILVNPEPEQIMSINVYEDRVIWTSKK